jgi:hypothetical protein
MMLEYESNVPLVTLVADTAANILVSLALRFFKLVLLKGYAALLLGRIKLH